MSHAPLARVAKKRRPPESGVVPLAHTATRRRTPEAATILAAAALLSSLAACDWRGHEHELKVQADAQGAQVSQQAAEADAFDQFCLRDSAACWDQLVHVGGRAVLGPAPGTTGATQVCCSVPRTDVSTDHSTPSSFILAVGAGHLQLDVVPRSVALRSAPPANGTVRSQPAQLIRPTDPQQRLTLRWVEGGVTYIAVATDLSEADAETALDGLTVHQP